MGRVRPDSAEILGKGGDDLIGGANASETREDMFKGEAVMLGVLAGARHLRRARRQSPGRYPDARWTRRLHWWRCRNEDDRVDAAGFKLLLEVGSG